MVKGEVVLNMITAITHIGKNFTEIIGQQSKPNKYFVFLLLELIKQLISQFFVLGLCIKCAIHLLNNR